MKEQGRKVLFLFFAVVFLCTGALTIRQLLDARSAEERNNRAEMLANLPSKPVPTTETPLPTTESAEETAPEPTEEVFDEETLPDVHTLRLLKLDLSSLRQVNSDIIGWIHLPGTEINYPLLHTTDNSTYLHTAWDSTSNVAGSIFLETRSNPNFSDFNTILYGHHMRNGSMFAPLIHYKEEAFLADHANIYIATATGVRKYTVFSAYEAPITSDTYRLLFKNTAQKQRALEHYLGSSQWDSPLTPSVSDQILTLSTCTGNGRYETRWVVQAVFSGFWANKKAGSPQETSLPN